MRNFAVLSHVIGLMRFNFVFFVERIIRLKLIYKFAEINMNEIHFIWTSLMLIPMNWLIDLIYETHLVWAEQEKKTHNSNCFSFDSNESESQWVNIIHLIHFKHRKSDSSLIITSKQTSLRETQKSLQKEKIPFHFEQFITSEHFIAFHLFVS